MIANFPTEKRLIFKMCLSCMIWIWKKERECASEREETEDKRLAFRKDLDVGVFQDTILEERPFFSLGMVHKSCR